ncbi:MAG: polyketide cyclase / dehydrase and lipid transport [Candidatus Nanopelagicales bacterium]|nr:polyketide cyclase / dehydrase and lipid transport [Candidatus Nanopelagicales bacterium]
MMVGVDLVDETFIAAAPTAVSGVVADPARWQEWFPDVELSVFMDRGVAGIRWSITGAFVGSMEIWLEPVGDGTTLHYYLRVVPTKSGSTTEPDPFDNTMAGNRKAARVRVRRAKAWKHIVWALKDELEGNREVGSAAALHTAPPTDQQ